MLRLTDKETIEFLEKISIIPNENETLDMIIDGFDSAICKIKALSDIRTLIETNNIEGLKHMEQTSALLRDISVILDKV